MVTAFRASSTGMRSSSPSSCPDLVRRQTAHHRVSAMSGRITGASWWKVKGSPASQALRAGLIRPARSRPKLRMWVSPQW